MKRESRDCTAQHMTPQVREDGHRRLTLIEGQVRGLQRMMDEDRYCVEVLTQIESVRAALRQVGRMVLRNHLETCVSRAVKQGDPRVFDEVMQVLNTFDR